MAWFGRRRKTTQQPVVATNEAPRQQAVPTGKVASAPAQRADCPCAPHEGPCGTVQPICPACHSLRTQVFVPSIVRRVQREGAHTAGCSGCEKRSFSYDADLICDTCQWLVPDVNDRLLERFTANGGAFNPKPGACPGCGRSGAAQPVSFPIQCPRCTTASMVNQQHVDTVAGVTAFCSNAACRFPIKIPATIWCQHCRVNLRSPTRISALIEEVNTSDTVVQHNLEEGGLQQTAQRIAELMDANLRRWDELPSAQRLLVLDRHHLDDLMSSGDSAEEWIRGAVEVRAIGHRLDREGGFELMRKTAEQARALSHDRATLRTIEALWDRIGDWRG
jgi:hypothetical protein